MHLHAVAPHELPDLWPSLRERVAACCARSGGKYEPLDVLMHCLSRRMDLWLALDEAASCAADHTSPAHSAVPPSFSAPADALRRRSATASAPLGDSRQITALAITEIVAYPRIAVCKLLACTGEDAARWVNLLTQIEAWAKAQGCAAMEPICRPGWERHLKPKGYRKTHVVLEKTL